ncbi:MAG: flagellar biosynthesis regulator FlaF [Proteobacteria bacterium]|nr:flagellar biosynthesis regulator FlaF [Pseudomonadota bacterium]
MLRTEHSRVQTESESPRETEYRLFSEVTRVLMSVGASDRSSEEFRQAIDRNRRLWAALRADLESEANWLARDLKAKLISLALWVDRHSEIVLDSQAEVGPLIAVNRTIMEGLVT